MFAYAQLVEHGASAAIEHECLLSIEISTHARRAEIKQRAQTAGSIETAAGQIVVDELRLVALALEDAGVGYVAALPPDLLASAIRHSTDPDSRAVLARRTTITGEDGCLPAAAGPLALEEEWTRVAAKAVARGVLGGALAAARRRRAFLAPLLTRGGAQRTVPSCVSRSPPAAPTAKPRPQWSARRATPEPQHGRASWRQRVSGAGARPRGSARPNSPTAMPCAATRATSRFTRPRPPSSKRPAPRSPSTRSNHTSSCAASTDNTSHPSPTRSLASAEASRDQPAGASAHAEPW